MRFNVVGSNRICERLYYSGYPVSVLISNRTLIPDPRHANGTHLILLHGVILHDHGREEFQQYAISVPFGDFTRISRR